MTTPTPRPDGDSAPDRDTALTPTLTVVGTPTPTATPTPTPTHAPTPTPTPDARRTDPPKIENGGESGRGVTAAPSPAPTADEPTWFQRGRAWFGGNGYLFLLTFVITVVASIGQKIYAESKGFVDHITINGLDFTPWFAPAVFDLAVAALLHGGLRAARERMSPWPWWTAAAVVAGLSVATNLDHGGGEITGPASAGLFLIWGLHLLYEYLKIVRRREVEDADAERFLQTDVLFRRNKRIANRAREIAELNSMTSALAYRHRLGEVQLTGRDVTIRAAKMSLDAYDTMLERQLTGAIGEDGEVVEPGARKRIWFWQVGARARARRHARTVASDAVDAYLGVPLLDRSNIRDSRVNFVRAEPGPVLGSAAAQHQLPLTDQAPAIDAPAAQQQLPPAPRPSARRVRAVEQQRPVSSPPVVVLAAQRDPRKPGGPAGDNWVALENIPDVNQLGLDPQMMCGHRDGLDKPCTRTLVDHVERRGEQIKQIVEAIEEWATRPEPIRKSEVEIICGLSGSGPQSEIVGIFSHLRRIAQMRMVQLQAVPAEPLELDQSAAG